MEWGEAHHRARSGVELGSVHIEIRQRLPADELLTLSPVAVDASPKVILAAGNRQGRDRAPNAGLTGLEDRLASGVYQEDRCGRPLGQTEIDPGAVALVAVQR